MSQRIILPLEERIIYYALWFSGGIHLMLIVLVWYLVPDSFKFKQRSVEIVYHSKPSLSHKRIQPHIEEVSGLKEVRQKISQANDLRKRDRQSMDPVLAKDVLRRGSPLETAEKQIMRVPGVLEKRSISIPTMITPKINNPQYLSYNDRVRDKIRNRAYFYIDDPKFEAGEIYLTFIVASDGTLKDVHVIAERSRANEYLRQVGLRAIRESSPFIPFPSDLKYPELTFNVVISFQVDQSQ